MKSSQTLSRRDVLRRAALLGLSAPAVAAFLDACGDSSNSNGRTRVNLYHTMPDATALFWEEQLMPSFRAQYPKLDLRATNLGVESSAALRTAVKAGGDSAPDMAWIESGEMGAYVDANLLADVDSWLSGQSATKADIFPSLVQLCTYKGKVWSLPWMTNNTAMLINTDAFNKAGVPIPSQDPQKTWTWDQFATACQAITEKAGMKGWLINNTLAGWDAWLFHAWIATAGGSFISDAGDPLFNGPEGQATMTFLQGLVKAGYTTYLDVGYQLDLWYAQKAAIVINGPWNFPDLQTFKKFNFTVVPFPTKTQPATNTGGDNLFIFNHSKDKVTYSFDYAAYMLSKDFQVQFNIESGNLPVTKSATNDTTYQAHLQQYPFLNGWVNGVPYGVARSALPQAADTQTAFGQKAWDPIITQLADVNSSLSAAAAAVTALKP